MYGYYDFHSNRIVQRAAAHSAPRCFSGSLLQHQPVNFPASGGEIYRNVQHIIMRIFAAEKYRFRFNPIICRTFSGNPQ